MLLIGFAATGIADATAYILFNWRCSLAAKLPESQTQSAVIDAAAPI
jgi:hypothetical protein